MTLAEFEATLTQREPPSHLPPLLQALWRAPRRLDTRARDYSRHRQRRCLMAARVPPRREGDLSNARYWYRHAGKTPATGNLDDEWRVIVEALLTR